MVRPTFEYNGQPVKAAGMLIWTEVGGQRHTLFRKYKGTWTDLGGKTDKRDQTILDTVVREVCEETNHGLFGGESTECASKVRDILESKHDNEIFYDAKCKYVLFVCRAHPSLVKLPMSRFGNAEGKHAHQYKWFTKTPQLHFRLRGFQFKKFI
tara:strand:+ start:568 stop:1029 length:462 start_codon:yes stop_codon:yes gene_type:complete